MTQQQLEKYAELVLFGIGSPENKNVFLSFEMPGRDLARKLAELCHKGGAKIVYYDMIDPFFKKSLIDNGSDEALKAVAPWVPKTLEALGSGEWLYIKIDGSNDQKLLNDLSPERSGIHAKALGEVAMPFSKKVSTFQIPWIIVLVPTEEKAMEAFPDLPAREAFAKYDEAVTEVLKLNEDAKGYWEKSFNDLSSRRDRYTEMGLQSLHFEDPETGTDFTVDLIPNSRWAAAEETLPTGEKVKVNIPSCEIFCCPDYRTARGKVRITKEFIPVRFPGKAVKGAWVEFEEGKVIQFGADEGEEVLKGVIEMDEQASYLGEVALVDKNSAVASRDMLFHNILYDENASCHIAFGSGFPSLVEGMTDAEKKDLLAAGINQSFQHQDVMIGTPNLKVTGVDKNGREVVLMEKGSFVR